VTDSSGTDIASGTLEITVVSDAPTTVDLVAGTPTVQP